MSYDKAARAGFALIDEAKMMQMQMGMNPGGAAWMPSQAFKAETSALSLATFNSSLLASERAMIAQGKRIVARAA
jgi:hypothetical protein